MFYPLLRNYPSEGFLKEVTAELAHCCRVYMRRQASLLAEISARLAGGKINRRILWWPIEDTLPTFLYHAIKKQFIAL